MISAVPLGYLLFTDLETGEPISFEESTARVNHFLDVVETVGNRMLGKHWNPRSLARLAKEVANPEPARPRNRTDALKWGFSLQDQKPYILGSRMKRLVIANYIPLLERAVADDAVLESILPLLAASEQVPFPALRAVAPAGTKKKTITSITREYRKYVEREKRVPSSITDLREPPRAPRKAVLSDVADQLAGSMARSGPFSMNLRLPAKAVPRSPRDYEWTVVSASWPEYAENRAVKKRSYPTLRVVNGRPFLDVAIEEDVPPEPKPSERPVRVLGLDWGITNPWVGAITVRAEDGRVLTDGAAYPFDGGDLIEKGARLARHSNLLHAKITSHERLLSGNPDDEKLLERYSVVSTEFERVNEKRRNVNTDLAHRAGRFYTKLAVENNVDTIAVENLADLEAGGLGKDLNEQISQSTRGRCVASLRHAARREGIRTVTAPAKGTSAECPGCGTRLLRPEYHVIRCAACSIVTDRDAAAAQRIGSRVHAGRITRDKNKNQVVRNVVHERVSKTREKLEPTPRQHAKKTKHVVVNVSNRSVPARPSSKGHRGAGRTSRRTGTSSPRPQGTLNRSPLGPGDGPPSLRN